MTENKLLKDFKEYLLIKKFSNKKGKTSQVSISGKKGQFIYFYPWSKVEPGNVEFFNNVESFLEQMKIWKVNITPSQEAVIRGSGVNYCSCIPNSPSVLVRHTFNDLKESIGKYVPGSSNTKKKIMKYAYGYGI